MIHCLSLSPNPSVDLTAQTSSLCSLLSHHQSASTRALHFLLHMNTVQSVIIRLTRDMLNFMCFLAVLSKSFQSSTNSHRSPQRHLVSASVTGAVFPLTASQNPWFFICFQEAVSSVQSLHEQYIFLANCFS